MNNHPRGQLPISALASAIRTSKSQLKDCEEGDLFTNWVWVLCERGGSQECAVHQASSVASLSSRLWGKRGATGAVTSSSLACPQVDFASMSVYWPCCLGWGVSPGECEQSGGFAGACGGLAVEVIASHKIRWLCRDLRWICRGRDSILQDRTLGLPKGSLGNQPRVFRASCDQTGPTRSIHTYVLLSGSHGQW